MSLEGKRTVSIIDHAMKKRELSRCVSCLVALLSLTGLFGCTAERDRLDEEVRRLCALDGGIKVHETVVLPAARFDKFGSVRVPDSRYAKPTDEYYYERETEILVRGNPDLLRFHTKLVRSSDKRVLGEAVSYVRRGGDIPGPWHPSSFSCPQDVRIAGKVFKMSEKKDTK
jgi:hypothetical protein